MIEPGKQVNITLHSRNSVNGKMSAWSPDSVTIRQRQKEVHIPRSDIARVALVAGMSRDRRAAWAGLIGGGVGAGYIGAICAAQGDCGASTVLVGAAGALFFGGIAAGIAALIPRHKEVIYVAKPAASGSGQTTGP